MVIKSGMRFDPELLLSAPRRSAGIPNPGGHQVLYSSSTYSFKTHKKDTELRVLNISTGESRQLAHNEDVADPVWLDDHEFLCLKAGHHGATDICVGSVGDYRCDSVGEHHSGRFVSAGTIDAPAGDLKIARLSQDTFAVVVSASASPDGKLFNSETAKKTHSTGRLYSKLFVRHWDRYETREKNSLWYAKLTKECQGKWRLSEFHNALEGLGLESPVQPFGGTDSFDVSKNGIIFVAKDPTLNPALNTKCNVYLLNVESWESRRPPLVQKVVIPGFEGASTCPCFSPDGAKAAFLSMRAPGYEADKNQIFVLPISSDSGKREITAERAFATTADLRGTWDRSPSHICFSADGKYILAIASEYGHDKVFMMASDFKQERPYTLTCKGSVSDIRCMANGHIFISGSSLVDNSFYAIVVPVVKSISATEADMDKMMLWTDSNTSHGNQFGLSERQVSWIQTPANNPSINKEVHSIVIKPSNFDKTKTYPVAYIIHGGPQSAFNDSWSTRWNLAVFAQQGYIVVAPNPTGSTGYGQAFTDAIRNNWGGDPYEDIVKVFDWVSGNFPQADNSRAVVLGASYGGYMMSWIQGHDLGRKFKCIVSHDGITTFAGGLLSTEELYFPFSDLGGTPWFDPGFAAPQGDGSAAQAHRNFGSNTLADWRRWDPSEHFKNWSTPQLVIHSAKDFRLPIAEGIAAFNVLQARGVDSQFLTFPDENHWVLKPENSLVWHKVVLNWINKYAGLPAWSNDDPETDAFYGGLREEGQEVANIMTQGDNAM